MEKLQAALAGLRSRATALSSKHKAAETALLEAKSVLQRHHLEGDIDGDEKATAKLEAAVAACTLKRDALADAISALQAQVTETEQKIATERETIARHAAADKLGADLDKVERVLPDFLEIARRLTDALAEIHWHYESGEMSRFAANTSAQLEVVAAFTLRDLRGTVTAIRDGSAPIPATKPKPEVTVIEQAPPTMTVFMMRSASIATTTAARNLPGNIWIAPCRWQRPSAHCVVALLRRPLIRVARNFAAHAVMTLAPAPVTLSISTAKR